MRNPITLAAVAAALLPVSGFAHNPNERSAKTDTLPQVSLGDVDVVARVNHLSEVSKVDLAVNPVKSSQEVLRAVPGLFIAQHAGGGKAEQMFLRGFDLDHGTDIDISVDGMPVNMVSHAHGQGYADLHFLQPEVIEHIDFDKGLYNMTKGDMATAGYVAFKTRDRMPNEAAVEIGMHDYQRYRASMSLIDRRDESLYFSGAFLSDNGFFDSPQHFKRLNAMAKYTKWTDAARFNIIASHFNSSWNASGQIPERAIDKGIIGWFGSLDASEGGSTSRTSLQFIHRLDLPDGARLNSDFYLSYYTFDLFSDFTFQLNDPEHWDEINQREKRVIAGGHTEYDNHFHVGEETWKWAAGAGFRYDHVMDIALYHAEQRHRLGTYSLGDIDESDLFGYAGIEMNVGRWMFNPSVRVDWFHFNYADKTAEKYDDRGCAQAFVSPKLNIIYNPSDNVQLYLKGGRGFHSNDARVVVVRNGKNVLPQALGADFGIHWKPRRDLMFNAAAWYLHMNQEFVYVGDEAVVEPSGKSRRFGIDLGARWEFLKYFYLKADYTYSNARMTQEPKGADYIPLAPEHTLLAGLTFRNKNVTASIHTRWIGDRPANEDWSLTAKGYCVTDLNASYTWRKFTFGVAIENLFDTRWREAQFATETLIPGDKDPVTDICFTPGTPFSLRGFVSFKF